MYVLDLSQVVWTAAELGEGLATSEDAAVRGPGHGC